MAWIEIVPPAEAGGVLKEAYDWQAARIGEPTEFTQLGSLYPEIVLERLRLYKAVEGAPSGLGREERALAALVTSDLNRTVHCASGLRMKLRELQVPDAVAAAVDADPRDPALDGYGGDRLAAILRYAGRLTAAPATIEEADVDGLRAVGLSDLDVLDLNNLVAYYNYINRVANGLGLRTPIPDPAHALRSVPA